MAKHDRRIDVLNDRAFDLAAKLQNGSLTCIEILDSHLDQIAKHNVHGLSLRAVISETRREYIYRLASGLDEELRTKGRRGPLHGIPLLVKDSFCTGPQYGVYTTCGTLALKMAAKDAWAVEQCSKAGMIIIGKANVDELCGNKGYSCITGWSAKGGQTQSPYVRGGVLENAAFLGHSTPGGSSSGSAVGVAVGFAPVAIATETDGSIVQPAARAALYALKPTIGSVPGHGVMPVSPTFDGVGSMARCVRDLVDLTNVLVPNRHFVLSEPDLGSVRVGYVDPSRWKPAPVAVEPNKEFEAQMFAEIDSALAKIEALSAKVVRNVELMTIDEVQVKAGGTEIEDLMDFEFKTAFEEYLGLFVETEVRTLQELIDFNIEHADVELPPNAPTQDTLIAALRNKMTRKEWEDSYTTMRRMAVTSVEDMLSKNDIDLILAPGDGRLASIAALTGYPHAVVPVGFADEFNGRAFGINIIASAAREDKIFGFMSAWEATFPEARRAPPSLVSWEETH